MDNSFVRKKKIFGKADVHDCIPVGYGADERYFPFVMASIYSILDHNTDLKFCFHIVIDELKPDDEIYIKKLLAMFPTNIIIYEVDDDIFAEHTILKYYSRAMYFRYLLPEIVNTRKHIYYFDSDIICINKATDFFTKINIGEKSLGVVIDIKNNKKQRIKALGIKGGKYFNSGVLIINTLKWKTEKILWRLNQFILENRKILRFPDQDALNVMLANDVVYIKKIYNCLTLKSIELNHVVFLHLASQPKPWSKYWRYSPMYTKQINHCIMKYYEFFHLRNVDMNASRMDIFRWKIKQAIYALLRDRYQEDVYELP